MMLKDCIRKLPVTHKDVEVCTEREPFLRRVTSYVKKGKWPEVDAKLAPFHNRRETLSVVGKCLMTGERVVILCELRIDVLKELHVGHPGIVRMKKLARSYMYCPNVDKDCEAFVRKCSRCQESAKSPLKKVPMENWSAPTRVWQRIHVDFARPIQGSHYMVVVDAFSKWPEVFEMVNISSGQTVKALKDCFQGMGRQKRS